MQQQKKVNIFTQFGFVQQDSNEKHAIGRCPFCGKDRHFFWNIVSDNKTWDCKSCGRNGGYKTFVAQMIDLCNKSPKLTSLANNRGLKVETLRANKIGYHELTKQYLIPTYSLDRKEVLNIKLYDGNTMRNLAGCSVSMYYPHENIQQCENIVVCEGEWDSLAMHEIIRLLKLKDFAVIGVPGAGVFKNDALPLTTDKNIFLLYDNDEAGNHGAEKAIKMLSSTCRKILRIKWPEGTDEGFDVRDLYKKVQCNPEIAWKTLLKWCENVEIGHKPIEASAELLDEGKAVSAECTIKSYKKWLHMPDSTLISVIFGTVLGNRLPGDPLWMFLVAEPGATKTEPLLSLTGCPRIEAISTLTPHTLISGANFGGSDPSLVPLLDEKVLIVKDFTSVLSMPLQNQEEIFGILRDAYDGECRKPFGNGIWRKYKSHFGIIAGVTPAIESHTEGLAALGERFLRFRNNLPDSIILRGEYIHRALDNSGSEVDMRKELHEAAKRVLSVKYGNPPVISKSTKSKIVNLALFVSMIRGTVSRDKYTKDILHKSFTELGTRVGKQLIKLVLGIGMFHQVEIVGEDEYKIAKRVAMASIPERLLDAIIYMRKRNQPITTADLDKNMKLSYNTNRMILENLTMLGAVVKLEKTYVLSDSLKTLIEGSELFK